jgi:hypothetical protein
VVEQGRIVDMIPSAALEARKDELQKRLGV